jgi:hypothetical protein
MGFKDGVAIKLITELSNRVEELEQEATREWLDKKEVA